MVTIHANCSRTIQGYASGVIDATFNGSQFVLLKCGECTLVDQVDLRETQRVCLPRDYSGICFDERNQCYWALGAGEARVYQLDTCFCEIGEFPIRGTYQQRANGIGCDCLENGIWLSFPSQVTFMEISGTRINCIPNSDHCRINLGIAALGCCRIVSCLANGKQFIEVTCRGNCERAELCIPAKYRLVGMFPCCKPHDEKGCVSKGCTCCVNLVLVEKCSCCLVIMECVITIDSSDMGCGQDECCRCCMDECCDGQGCGGCGCREDCCRGKYEIMHSIALEEAGISHILNAEGEKLQKAVASTDDINQLLCVNESIRRTITQVTLLEGQLYSKLEALQGGCWSKDVWPPDPCGCRPPECGCEIPKCPKC